MCSSHNPIHYDIGDEAAVEERLDVILSLTICLDANTELQNARRISLECTKQGINVESNTMSNDYDGDDDDGLYVEDFYNVA